MQELQEDNDFFYSFPSLIKLSTYFYRKCLNVIHMLKDPIRFHKNHQQLRHELIEYVKLRNDFFDEMENIMGHYGTI